MVSMVERCFQKNKTYNIYFIRRNVSYLQI